MTVEVVIRGNRHEQSGEVTCEGCESLLRVQRRDFVAGQASCPVCEWVVFDVDVEWRESPGPVSDGSAYR